MWKKSLPYFEGIDSRHWFVFTYDPIGRVIATLNPDGSQTTVAYLRGTKTLVDANNHMKQEDYDGAGRLRQVREYTTGGDPYAVTQAGDDKTYLYDNNGNMTQKDSTQHTIVWNEDNKPQTITDNSQDTRFVYDYQGQRVKKIDANGSTTTYIGNYYECTDGTCTRHTFAGSKRFASHTPGESYYYHTDHLGGLYTLTKGSDGTSAEFACYYPFGGTRVDSGSANLPYKFTGQELDPETKLYNFNARQYHADLGRFISPDSIVPSPGDPQTLNRYSYCRNNPQLFVDPTGHLFGIDDLIIAGILIGAALNTTIAAIQGRDLGMAALTGAISGGLFTGAGIAGEGLDSVVQAGIHAAAGAISGAINAGITGGNVLQSALIGGISAGVAKYGMAGILPNTSLYKQVGDLAGNWGQIAMKGAVAVGTGTVTGGFSSMMMGGSFGAGAAQGTWTSAYGFLFNGIPHLVALRDPGFPAGEEPDSSDYDPSKTTSDKETTLNQDVNWGYGALAVTHAMDAVSCLGLALGTPVGVGITFSPVAGVAVFFSLTPEMIFASTIFWSAAREDWHEFVGH